MWFEVGAGTVRFMSQKRIELDLVIYKIRAGLHFKKKKISPLQDRDKALEIIKLV
jgi:hypothetical protein